MKNIKVVFFALLIGVVKSSLIAQDPKHDLVLSFGVNSVDFAEHGIKNIGKALEDGVVFDDLNILPSISRVSVSKYIDKGFSLELAGALNKISKTPMETVDDSDYFSVDLAGRYNLNSLSFMSKTGWFDPYVQIGVGISFIDGPSVFTINPGFGFNAWFNERFGINFQSSYKSVDISGSSSETNLTSFSQFQKSIGLVVRFAGTDTDGDGIYDNKDICPEEAGLEKFNGCPDSDSDGVVDSDDLCPNIAGLIYFKGCPDTDTDGIADRIDKCPTEKGLKANRGCPDVDNDGIIDRFDDCPKVLGPESNKGCPWPDDDEIVMEKIELSKTIYFDTGKATLIPELIEKLDKIIVIMGEFRELDFYINGHSDNVGNQFNNLKLSELRATNTRDYLVSKGIDSSRLHVQVFASMEPVASNDTEEGRAANRRVEIISIEIE